MNNIFLFAIMLIAGAAVAAQPSINGRLAQKVGVLESSFISFAVGALVLLVVVLTTGRGNLRAVSEAAWWELLGGFLGAFFVSMTIVAVPRIGTASTMAAVITAQLITGLILDSTGIFGLRTFSLDMKRMLGAGLLIAGALLVFRR
ncbi:MAG TPA: DMT family transporter [Dissulfurispiraceae bacterium]